MKNINTELQESRAREETYRSQMTELLEQNRLLRAECNECRQQAELGRAQAHSLQKAIRHNDASESSRFSTHKIAQDEIKFLEHELSRLTNANQILTDDVLKYENMIYGRAPRNATNKQNMSMSGGDIDQSAVRQQRSKQMTPRAATSVTPATTHTRSLRKSANKSHIKNSTQRSTSSNSLKWRTGCTRSPLRCSGSSLLLLPADEYEIVDFQDSPHPLYDDENNNLSRHHRGSNSNLDFSLTSRFR